jgi:hypothetical protein
MLMRGLLNAPSMNCTALVNPEAKLLEVMYEPAEAVFVCSDDRVRMLLNWVNSRLHVGRFYAWAPKKTMVRSDLLQLAYRAAIPYAGVDKSHVKLLARNLFQELAGFYDLYIPMVKALVEQKLSYSTNGQLEGPAADQVFSQQTTARQQLGKTVQQGSPTQLLNSLQQQLDASGIRWRPATGGLMLRLNAFDESNDQAWHYAYVTDLGEVVLEARSRWTVQPERQRAVIGSKYLLFLNLGWTDSGAYFLDVPTGQMVYRAGLNAKGMEKQLPAALLRQLVVRFIQMSDRLNDLGHVAEASVRGSGEGWVEYRGSTYEEVVAAVVAAMAMADDPQIPVYVIMRQLFDSQVGMVLEDIDI